jgi:hypothetical protein
MPFKLPNKLGSFEDLKKRFTKAKARKELWVTHMRECYEFALPQRETFYQHRPGEKKNTTIYDDTAVTGVQKFASRLQATLVPPWRNWTTFKPGSDVPKEQHDDIQKDLDEVTSVVFDHINHSNFATQSNECFLDVAVGTGILVCNEGTGEDLLEFNAVPLSEAFLEEGPAGTIETVWREHKVQVNHIERLWPGAELSTKMKQTLQKEPDSKTTLVEGSVYCPDAKMYHTLVMDFSEKHLIYRSDSETSAWIVPRWSTIAGEIYGRGPVMSILPTIKTVNKVKEFILRNAALAISGVYTSLDDGVLNPYTVRIAPGAVLPVGSNDSRNPTLRALERSGDFNVGEFVLADLQEDIKRALFNTMRDPSDAVVSATQFALEHKDLIADAGSSYGRLQTEFVEKVLKRVVHILSKNGKIPDIKVDGREITLKHTSPLARAQDNEDILTFQHFVEILTPFGPQVMAGGVKTEDLPAWLGKKLGVEQDVLRTETERKQIMEQTTQALSQAAETEQ